MEQTLDCDRFAEGYCARLSSSIVYHAVQTNFNFPFCKQIFVLTIQVKA